MVAYMDAESVVKAITEHETKIIAAEHRIKDLEEQSKNLQSLTISVNELAQSIKFQSKQLEEQSEKIDKIEQSKRDSWKYWVRLILGAVATGLVGYYLGFIIHG